MKLFPNLKKYRWLYGCNLSVIYVKNLTLSTLLEKHNGMDKPQKPSDLTNDDYDNSVIEKYLL